MALLVLVVANAAARASVSLLLEQPYGGLGLYNPTGHSALYFDHICAATPLELRPCQPGELGVVISRYDGIGELDWVAIPLVPYLYAADSTSKVPAHIDSLSVLRKRDLYRREHLEQVAPDTPSGGMPEGNWYELIGSSYNRTIFGFRVNTTPEQDAELIEFFNDRRNVTRYNGAFNNCADFARVVLNRLYPHSIRRNYVADFGMTTPKSVARGLAHYARKHPELELTFFTIPQLMGDLPRSVGVEGVTESLLKRYGVPLVILSPHVTAVVFVAYVGRGRFSMPKHAPVLDVAAMEREAAERAHPATALVSAGAGSAAAYQPELVGGQPHGEAGEILPAAVPSVRANSMPSAFSEGGYACAFCDATPLPCGGRDFQGALTLQSDHGLR